MSVSVISEQEIRIFLMDFKEVNPLLDGVRWSSKDIEQASINIVDMFNVMNPPTGHAYSIETFPSRYLLLMGVAGYLLKSAGINQLNNNLSYSADGVQINDLDAGPAMLQTGAELSKEFKELAQQMKVSQNIAQVYGTQPSEFRTLPVI